jgi:hypothetical protein
MKRVKTFLVWLSALLCLAAMVAWGFGILGVGFYFGREYEPIQPIGWDARGIKLTGYRGAVSIGYAPLVTYHYHKRGAQWNSGILDTRGEDVWETISGNGQGSRFYLRFPYYLLILLFAIAPALRLWGNYAARREKKLLDEAVAQKRAEHPHLDIKEPKG